MDDEEDLQRVAREDEQIRVGDAWRDRRGKERLHERKESKGTQWDLLGKTRLARVPMGQAVKMGGEQGWDKVQAEGKREEHPLSQVS